jgi:hypothetical protein
VIHLNLKVSRKRKGGGTLTSRNLIISYKQQQIRGVGYPVFTFYYFQQASNAIMTLATTTAKLVTRKTML